MNNPLSAHDTAQQLAVILNPKAVYEVRALGVFESDDPRTDIYSALFYGREVDELAREVLRLSGKCKGIYATINPLKDQRFGALPGTHRLRPARTTTRDADIPDRRELVLDFDADRAAGHEHDPATDGERAVAWADLVRARERLTAEGYPAPTVEDSGNGYYLRYRLDPFPVVKGDDVIHRVLEALGADTTVCNPARIMRLPGGLNCKGKASAERPWRVARLLEIGSPELVTREQLERVAADAPSTKKKSQQLVKQAADAVAMQAFNAWAGIVPTAGGCTRLTPALEERASRYLDTIAPGIQGEGNGQSSKNTLWAARVLIHGFRFSEADAFNLLARHYNPRCVPPWSEKELQHKVADAATKPFRKQEGWALESRQQQPFRGYDDLSPAELRLLAATEVKEIRETVPVPVEGCPYQASADMRNEINLTTTKCPNQSPVRFEKGGVRFVCYRDCGNGTECRACLEKRLNKLLKMTDSYLIRTSTEANETANAESPTTSKTPVASEPNAPRVVYGAIAPTAPTPAMKRMIQRRGGERVAILTDDPVAVATLLAGENGAGSAAGGDVSRFFLLMQKNPSLGEIATPTPPAAEPDSHGHLHLLSLPAGAVPPTGFQRVGVAAAIRAIHHAAKTVPAAPEGASRYKPVHKSAEWGDEEEKVPTETKCLGPSAFTPNEVRDILRAANVPVIEVQFDGKRTRTTGAGWCLPPVQSAALNLWIGGTASPCRPTAERVIELAQAWLPELAKIGNAVGEGPRVQEVLRDNMWYVSLYDIGQKLRDADEQDKAAESFRIEAESILRDLRNQYRGREHEATELVAVLLA